MKNRQKETSVDIFVQRVCMLSSCPCGFFSCVPASPLETTGLGSSHPPPLHHNPEQQELVGAYSKLMQPLKLSRRSARKSPRTLLWRQLITPRHKSIPMGWEFHFGFNLCHNLWSSWRWSLFSPNLLGKQIDRDGTCGPAGFSLFTA